MNSVEEKFNSKFGPSRQKLYSFFAPGRLNFIGEHLDYNGGYVLPFAISLGITMHIRINESNMIKWFSEG